jgi:hypothetical protein
MIIIVKAYSEVEKVLHGDDTLLHSWYAQAEKLAQDVNVSPLGQRVINVTMTMWRIVRWRNTQKKYCASIAGWVYSPDE